MAGKGIAELTRATSVTDTDLFITETAEGTRSIEYTKLKEPLQEEIEQAKNDIDADTDSKISEAINGVKEEITKEITDITINITNIETTINENKNEIDTEINNIKVSMDEIKNNIIILTDKIADCNCSSGSGGGGSIIGDTLTPEDIICTCYPLANQHDLLNYTPTYSAAYDWKKLSDLNITKATSQTYMDAYVLYLKLPKDKFISNIISKNRRHRFMDKPSYLGEYDNFNIYYMLCYVPYYDTNDISAEKEDNGKIANQVISPKFNLELSDTKRIGYFVQNLKAENISSSSDNIISNCLNTRDKPYNGGCNCDYTLNATHNTTNVSGYTASNFAIVIDIPAQYRLINISFDNSNTILEYALVSYISEGSIQYILKIKNADGTLNYDLNGTYTVEERGFTF